MDDRDRRLLDLLRRDARQPIVGLAKALNLSRSATQDRLAKLQSAGIIDGFTIREGSRAGAVQSAYLMVSFESGFRCAQVVPKLQAIPSIGMIHSVTGPIDLVIRIERTGDFSEARPIRIRFASLSVLRLAEQHAVIGVDGIPSEITEPSGATRL